jgi:phosphocarrier protein
VTTSAERRVTIVNPLGLHARPAAEFVKVAGRFRAEVHVEKDGMVVNGKSIMGVMTLAAECGSTIRIRAEGADAEAALAALADLVNRGFNEAYAS